MKKIITTSWDDGHPLDFKISKLLLKYNLKGTFYIPLKNRENEVMTEQDILKLAMLHEIGGHTINHVNLKKCRTEEIKHEITNSYLWLNKLLNKKPIAFCFPKGKWDNHILNVVINAGYKVCRTTELFSLRPQKKILPTSIQIYHHTRFTIFKHLIKRLRIANLYNWMKSGMKTNLLDITNIFLTDVKKNGGCLHIWGHSWEIEKFKLWDELEEIFKLISNVAEIQYLENGEIIEKRNA